jgi:dihydropteroate synthase
VADILACCERLLAEGADILDIGGESTRPGASPVPIELEEARVLPVLKHALRLGCAVSVDTSEPRLMQKALDLGADIINDVRALRRPGALQTVASAQRAGLCLMHMRGEPADMQADPQYGDVVAEVAAFLSERLDAAGAAGIAPERIVLDPGFGFGKTDAHNQGLAQGLPRLQALGRPLLVGWSRKGTLGRLTDRPLHERQSASLAAALAAVAGGAVLLRVHDVAATVDALKVWRALSPQT